MWIKNITERFALRAVYDRNEWALLPTVVFIRVFPDDSPDGVSGWSIMAGWLGWGAGFLVDTTK